MSNLLKARFVGRKTVKGPSSSNTEVRSAAFNAVSKIEKFLLAITASRIVPCALTCIVKIAILKVYLKIKYAQTI